MKKYTFVSLPAMYLMGIIFCQELDTSSDVLAVVSGLWLEETYPRQARYWDRKPQECTMSFPMLLHDTCLNFSSLYETEGKYYILLRLNTAKVINIIRDNEDHGKISWLNATHSCAVMGGYLPYFLHRQELKEFIAIHKLSNKILLVEGTYMWTEFKNEEVNCLLQHFPLDSLGPSGQPFGPLSLEL